LSPHYHMQPEQGRIKKVERAAGLIFQKLLNLVFTPVFGAGHCKGNFQGRKHSLHGIAVAKEKLSAQRLMTRNKEFKRFAHDLYVERTVNRRRTVGACIFTASLIAMVILAAQSMM